jgi:hypothetical protein
MAGFVVGWSFAFLRNLSLFIWVAVLRGRASWQLLRRFPEFV